MPNKRTQLSGKQWLNIIIISVSLMFLILVLVGRMMNKRAGDISSQTLSGQVALIKIDFGEVTLWRDNSIWYSTNKSLSKEKINLIIKNWNLILNQTGEVYLGSHLTGKTVLLYLSNIQQPVVCKVSLYKDKMLITFVSTSRQFILEKHQFENYYPGKI
ncbi:hypothetical protein [Aliikangiella sp. IMCC44359]|uniref:hypothetical protein n=1 Tax=Aliikangiella sp. IMCC44359 TaxID=3459125 RepID=UPI00403B2BED